MGMTPIHVVHCAYVFLWSCMGTMTGPRFSVYTATCHTHPVLNSNGVFNGDHAEPSLGQQTEIAKDLPSQSQADSSVDSGLKISLFKASEKTRESANLESEGVPSKVLTLYDNSQKNVKEKTQPLPILDTISEHEKYGNNGDMFDGISRSLLNGYEAFSNLLNTLITKPKEIARSFSKGITAQLDIIGGKLVGL